MNDNITKSVVVHRYLFAKWDPEVCDFFDHKEVITGSYKSGRQLAEMCEELGGLTCISVDSQTLMLQCSKDSYVTACRRYAKQRQAQFIEDKEGRK